MNIDNGYATVDLVDKNLQIDAYAEWLKESVAITGKLEVSDSLIKSQTLKKSRVTEAIAKMPPKPAMIPVKKRPTQHRPITPIIEEAPFSDDLGLGPSDYGSYREDHRDNLPAKTFQPENKIFILKKPCHEIGIGTSA